MLGCCATRVRPCCACCRRRCSEWCATTARRATIFARCGCASPAATKFRVELEKEFTDLAGFEIDETYGMTEIGIATMNPPSGPNRIGSIGKLGPGFVASIRDDDGREVPAGSEGRMWIKAPSNMVGYWNHPDATAETIVDGWLDTGDVVSIDADGYVWFRGRQKQIIIHDGSNICPQEVEESLLEHPAVENAGVIGIHNLVHGENVRAYIAWQAGRRAADGRRA